MNQMLNKNNNKYSINILKGDKQFEINKNMKDKTYCEGAYI